MVAARSLPLAGSLFHLSASLALGLAVFVSFERVRLGKLHLGHSVSHPFGFFFNIAIVYCIPQLRKVRYSKMHNFLFCCKLNIILVI